MTTKEYTLTREDLKFTDLKNCAKNAKGENVTYVLTSPDKKHRMRFNSVTQANEVAKDSNIKIIDRIWSGAQYAS